MTSLKKNLIDLSKIVVLALILAAGLQYVSAVTWVAPTGSPPGNNTPAPLNGTVSSQSKLGGLTVATGSGITTGFIVANGNVGIGTLTPDVKLDVVGYVKGRSGLCIGSDCRTSWPAGGSGGGGTYTAGNGLSLSGSTFSINSPACSAGFYSRWTGSGWDCNNAGGGSGNVAFNAGVVNHGDTIPLPAGMTEANCKWIVSVMKASYGGNRGIDRAECSANGTRLVSCYLSQEDNSGVLTDPTNIQGSYIIICKS